MRNIAKMIEDHKLISVPLNIDYKSGGGGAIASNFIRGKANDPYYLLNGSGNTIAAPLRDPSVASYKDFTPIALRALDLNTVVVPANSPYRTMKDLVEAAKAKPGQISWAGTSVGSQDHLTILQLQRKTGAKFSFVSFTGSNEIIAALLGGHVDVACMEPWVAKPQADGGKVRILGLVADNRMSTIPDLPTLKEQGFDVVLAMQRGVLAPGGIPKEATDYLINAFKKLSDLKVWKEYLAKEGLMEVFKPGDEYTRFLAAETEKWGDLQREAGLIKKK
jgi:putative tricarboxylic transport membrane protein